MEDSSPQDEIPRPKNEVPETPPAVNVPTMSNTESQKKKDKKLSLWARFVNMMTPEVGRFRNAFVNHELTVG